MTPLVTVLLCHRNIRELARTLAIPSYLSQDYEDRELVVVDSGDEPIADLLTGIDHCRYFPFPGRNLSEKRNFGAKVACGEYIVHFDADDWSGPHRISDQVALMQNGAEVAGYDRAYWYDFASKKASYYRGYIWGANLIYRTDYALTHPWDEKCQFIEDAAFIKPARDSRAIVTKDGDGNFVATLNDRSTKRNPGEANWPFVPVGQLPDGFRKAAGLC